MQQPTEREAELERQVAALRAALEASWRDAVGFPYPQICKHLVAGNILDEMERAGIETPRWVHEAVAFADDARALSFDRGDPGAEPPARTP